jgi:dCTP deaminase
MILTGQAIQEEVFNGNIIISPFNVGQLNPNSYNYRIQNTLRFFDYELNKYIEMELSKTGVMLEPRKLYLANTAEIIGSKKYVTSLIGRSSIGRLGLFVQLSADLANLGDAHKWTLELTCVQPFILYPYMKIGQVSFWVPCGQIKLYTGKYNKFNTPKECIYTKLKRYDK